MSTANGIAQSTLELVAFHAGRNPTVKIVPASRWRDWMNATEKRWANRCLPLLMANQAGWMLLTPAAFTVTWDGGDAQSCMTIDYPEDTPEEAQIAVSHFGYGIVTFRFRDMIRTAPGYNLFARGPTNWPKDGICALDGLVETDWSAAPFTMNWKLTRPGSVSFAEDEPFCQILPQRRGELERFDPSHASLDDDPELAKRVEAWAAHRGMAILAARLTRESGAENWTQSWLSDYFKGSAPTGEQSPEHQTKLSLKPFAQKNAAHEDV